VEGTLSFSPLMSPPLWGMVSTPVCFDQERSRCFLFPALNRLCFSYPPDRYGLWTSVYPFPLDTFLIPAPTHFIQSLFSPMGIPPFHRKVVSHPPSTHTALTANGFFSPPPPTPRVLFPDTTIFFLSFSFILVPPVSNSKFAHPVFDQNSIFPWPMASMAATVSFHPSPETNNHSFSILSEQQVIRFLFAPRSQT